MGARSHAKPIERNQLGEPSLVAAWRGLAELRENPFLTPEWYRASIEAYPDERPAAIAWRAEGEVRGVLPLVAVSKGPLKLLRFAGARRGDWFTPACRPADEEAMGADCATLLERERGWQAIRLDRVESGSVWPAALRLGDRAGIAVAPRRREDVLPYVEFDQRGYNGYLADRSRNFRSQLGRRRRRLEREHGLAFRLTATPTELEADLDTFFRLHDDRWRRRGGSTLEAPSARRHLRLFAAAALERGWLRLWTAEADGEPAASWYGWRIGDRYCYALAGLGAEYERHGLGTVLLAHTIEQAATEGAAVYDLMWGDEGYKERFETGRRRVATWMVTRRRHPARVAVAAGVRSARALEGLPPSLRQPLGKLRQAAGRS